MMTFLLTGQTLFPFKGTWPDKFRLNFKIRSVFIYVAHPISGCEWEKYEPSIGTKISKTLRWGQKSDLVTDLQYLKLSTANTVDLPMNPQGQSYISSSYGSYCKEYRNDKTTPI